MGKSCISASEQHQKIRADAYRDQQKRAAAEPYNTEEDGMQHEHL